MRPYFQNKKTKSRGCNNAKALGSICSTIKKRVGVIRASYSMTSSLAPKAIALIW